MALLSVLLLLGQEDKLANTTEMQLLESYNSDNIET